MTNNTATLTVKAHGTIASQEFTSPKLARIAAVHWENAYGPTISFGDDGRVRENLTGVQRVVGTWAIELT